MWQLGTNVDYQELSKFLKDRKDRLFDNAPNCKTVLTSHLDVTSWFEPEALEYWGDLVPEIPTISLTQNYEQYLSEDMTGYLDLEMITAHGQGSGSIAAKIKSLLSEKSQGEITLSLGSKRYISYSIHHRLTQMTYLSFTMQGNYYGGIIKPFYQFSINRAIGSNSRIGALIAGSDLGGICGCNLACGPFNLELQLNRNIYLVKLRHLVPLSETAVMKLKMESNSEQGVFLSAGIVKEVPEILCKFGLHVQIGGFSGVTLKLQITRFDYNLIIPLHLSRYFSFEAVLLGSILPAFFSFLVQKTIWSPIKSMKKKQKWREFLIKQRHFLEKKREEAELIWGLLQEPYEKRIASLNHTSLFITKAYYRDKSLPTFSIDVTIPLQMMIVDNQLVIDSFPKFHLLGFYDVSPEHSKELFIEYRFRNLDHEAVYDDTDLVNLPLKSHQIKK
jgi:hypothetical protein